MGIRPFRVMPTNEREWARFFQQTEIQPDDGSVTPDALAPDTLSQFQATADASSSAAVSAHVALDDPHTQYATDAAASALAASAQAGAISEANATASAALVAHVAAADPHPGYLTQTEGDARYRELTDAVTYGELTGKPAGLALIFSGTGTPEAAVTAGVGALFLRTDGGAGTTLYVKESGAGNTGWIGK